MRKRGAHTMPTTYIFDTLRAHLKARHLTYKDLAQAMGLSEASVKRLFASGDMNLQRLEQMCHFLQIEMADLFKSIPPERALIARLTHAQEAELVRNKKLLMIAVCALNFWTVQDMGAHLRINKPEIQALLRRLDAIGFLELRNDRQYRLLVSHNFSWITSGPIMRMVQGMSHDYFDSNFEGEGQVLRILNVRIAKASQARLRLRLEQIAQEYVDQSRSDSHLPLHERPTLSVCIAARVWVPLFMQELLKVNDKTPPLNLPRL